MSEFNLYADIAQRSGGAVMIGVVGPTRMDYSAVAAKLSILAAGLSRRLGGGEAPPEGLHNKLIIKGDSSNE